MLHHNRCALLFSFALLAGLVTSPSLPLLAQSQAQSQTPPAARASTSRSASRAYRDLVYATVGGQSLKLDLYLPAASATPTPLLIHIHGGGWSMGNKNGVPAYCSRMLDLGFAVASVQYRLTTQSGLWGEAPVTFPAQIQDVKGAVRWLRANAGKYNLDPDRFAAWGESAGGHLSALLATSGGAAELEGDVGGNPGVSSRIQAAVDYFGPTDLLRIADDATTGSRTAVRSMSAVNPITMLIGYKPRSPRDTLKDHIDDPNPPYASYRKLLEMANPITYVGPQTPPIFIGQGGADPLVPAKQSRRLEQALHQAGIRTQLMITPGAGHGGLSLETHRAAIRFLCETLKPEAVDQLASLKFDAPRARKKNAAPGLVQRMMKAFR